MDLPFEPATNIRHSDGWGQTVPNDKMHLTRSAVTNPGNPGNPMVRFRLMLLRKVARPVPVKLILFWNTTSVGKLRRDDDHPLGPWRRDSPVLILSSLARFILIR